VRKLENALAEAVAREQAAVAAESNMRKYLRDARNAEDNLADALAATRSHASGTQRLLNTMRHADVDVYSAAVAVEASNQATAIAMHELVKQVDYCIFCLTPLHYYFNNSAAESFFCLSMYIKVKEAQQDRDAAQTSLEQLRRDRIDAAGVRVSLEGKIAEHRQAFANLTKEVKMLREALASKASSTKLKNMELQSRVSLLENQLVELKHISQINAPAILSEAKGDSEDANESEPNPPSTPEPRKSDMSPEVSPVLAAESPNSINMPNAQFSRYSCCAHVAHIV
jgi:hypothetical protein